MKKILMALFLVGFSSSVLMAEVRKKKKKILQADEKLQGSKRVFEKMRL